MQRRDDDMSGAEPLPNAPKLRGYQYRLLTLVAIAAVLCSVIRVAAPFVPMELGGVLVLAMVVSAVPGVLIGRRISRTLESVYLSLIWGVWLATLVCIPDILGMFVGFWDTPAPVYTASKVVIGSLIGGSCGGFVMWRIKEEAYKA
jgi:hypothetical protein